MATGKESLWYLCSRYCGCLLLFAARISPIVIFHFINVCDSSSFWTIWLFLFYDGSLELRKSLLFFFCYLC